MDTRDKRASALACGLAFLVVLPAPDGLALDQGDRQQTASVYCGIAAGLPVVVTPSYLDIEGGYGLALDVAGGNGLALDVVGGYGLALDVEGGG